MPKSKMEINGVVLCPCGHQIISNSGKVMLNYKEHKLHCWGCGKGYPMNDVFAQRVENEHITYKEIQ